MLTCEGGNWREFRDEVITRAELSRPAMFKMYAHLKAIVATDSIYNQRAATSHLQLGRTASVPYVATCNATSPPLPPHHPPLRPRSPHLPRQPRRRPALAPQRALARSASSSPGRAPICHPEAKGGERAREGREEEESCREERCSRRYVSRGCFFSALGWEGCGHLGSVANAGRLRQRISKW